MKYLRNLNNHNDYTTFIVGTDFAEIQAEKKAVVSYCKADAHVHYNPYVEPPFFCKLTLNDDSVVELEGSGELTSDMTSDYKSTLVSAEIGSLCTSIGNTAFASCSSLTNVTIPNTVTSIGSNAFYYCSGLTSIDIPSSVTSISERAFFYCTGLTSVIIPDSVTSIAYGAFYGCSSLTNVTIPDTVTSISDSAFSYCSGLTSIVIPDSVTSIGNWIFDNCSSLTSINIPDSVTSIGYRAFYNCGSLTSIISNAMTAPTIKDNTFQGIKTGGTLTVPSSSTGYDAWMDTGDYYLGSYNWTKVEQ